MTYFEPDRHLRCICRIYSRIRLKLSTTAAWFFPQFWARAPTVFLQMERYSNTVATVISLPLGSMPNVEVCCVFEK